MNTIALNIGALSLMILGALIDSLTNTTGGNSLIAVASGLFVMAWDQIDREAEESKEVDKSKDSCQK